MKTRTINGLFYDKKFESNIKYKADDNAKNFRKNGFGARVIKTKGTIPLFEVFVSRNKLKR